jgi:hypothetical protein
MKMKRKLLRFSACVLILGLCLSVLASASAAGFTLGRPQTVALTGSTADPGLTAKGFTLSFEDEILVNLYYTVSDPDSVTEHGMLVFHEAPTQVKTMVRGGDGKYWAQVDGIAAKSLDQTYYVAGCYTDESGNRHCTGVIAYSLSKYCVSKAVPGNTMEALAAATAMYGYYAAEYFDTNVPVSTAPTLTVGTALHP